MAYPVLTGAVLMEANGAALNNAGQEQGTRVDNTIVVKQIRIGRLRYPYVSGQAWRRWWREVLYIDFGWQPSGVTVIKKPQQVFTVGDPIRYEEDDLFGYMVARKRAKNSKKLGEGGEEALGTFRRVSPLKNSLLISVLPNVIERDFGHFTRNLPQDADPLPYETEHYTTHLQGVFTISLTDVGRFEMGEMHDLSEDIIKTHEGELQANGERLYSLHRDWRVKRIQDVLKALARLRGGAHLARNLSDVAPVAALVGFLNGGNAPLQRLFEPDENNERVRLNLERLCSVLSDYGDCLLAPINGKALYFGYRPTVLANETDVLKALKDDEAFKTYIEVVGTPRQALEKVASAVAPVFEQHIKE